MASHQFTGEAGRERRNAAVDFRQSAGKTDVKPTTVEVVHESHDDQYPPRTSTGGVMANVTGMAVHAADSAKNTAAGVASAAAHAAQSAKDTFSGTTGGHSSGADNK